MSFPLFDNPLFLAALPSAALLLLFLAPRLRRYLRYFQQEEYSALRFLRWYWKNRAFDRRVSLVLMGTAALAWAAAAAVPGLVIALAAAAALGIVGRREPDPRKEGKIKLIMTARAARIFWTAFAAAAVLAAAACAALSAGILNLPLFLLSLAVVVQLLPAMLILGNWLLAPVEARIKQRYLNEAKTLIRTYKPFTIGITGSYGKTSTKMVLGELLQAAVGPTFCPPKSINTPMGITREIRTKLSPQQRFAVIEMGAYNVGSIARLCDLTPPNAAIVTAVGIAHLERYGSPERVYQAKSELPARVPDDGILVCNGDNEGARRMASEFKKARTFLYGLDNSTGDLDCWAAKISFSPQGSAFDLHWQGRLYSVKVQHLGRPALSNILGAFTMTCALGADPTYVAALLPNLKPVDNRLVLSQEGAVYWLRDAYNSNPVGFAAALEVLAGVPAVRRILITPGMVELGSMQSIENERAAAAAAEVCDKVIIVGDTNQAALRKGLSGGPIRSDSVIIAAGREDGFATLREMLQPGDCVLVENDLPDLYETVEKF